MNCCFFDILENTNSLHELHRLNEYIMHFLQAYK